MPQTDVSDGPTVPPMDVRLVFHALCFALGAILIGLVVIPTSYAFEQGITTAHFVSGRLFWGAVTVFIWVSITNPKQLIRSKAEHFRFARSGLLIGWGTTFLYTIALNGAAVAPVIITIVGMSAVVGMVVETYGKFRLGHTFVLVAVVLALAAVIFSVHNDTTIATWALVAAIASGSIYGLLPILNKTASVKADVASVAFYLLYGFIISACWALISNPSDTLIFANSLVDPNSVLAGIFCTGLGYALFQVGISPTTSGETIGSSWATLMYGCEPIAAIIVASLFLNEPFSTMTAIFTAGFLVLTAIAGPVLKQL
ncbi:MAG TPA: hypothetical protein DD827_07050 [Gammaproteobacteria bacterium]|nr:hypothetical protein [Gammaproteobacteria bacterium]